MRLGFSACLLSSTSVLTLAHFSSLTERLSTALTTRLHLTPQPFKSAAPYAAWWLFAANASPAANQLIISQSTRYHWAGIARKRTTLRTRFMNTHFQIRTSLTWMNSAKTPFNQDRSSPWFSPGLKTTPKIVLSNPFTTLRGSSALHSAQGLRALLPRSPFTYSFTLHQTPALYVSNCGVTLRRNEPSWRK